MHSIWFDHFIFKRATLASRTRLESHSVRRRVIRGSLVFARGDAPGEVLGVSRGLVKVSVVGVNGKEATLNMFRDGDVFGEIAALDGRPRTADAVALVDTDLVSLPRAVLIELIEQDPAVARACIELLCDRLRNTTEQVETVMTLDVRSRVATTHARLSEPDENGARRARVTQAQLAQYTGVTREIVNRCLGDWRRQGWVRLDRGAILLADLAALAALDPQ